MRWFDDLWLKEGFARTWLRMQASLDTVGAWKSFYLRNKPLAYAVDAARHDARVATLENLDQAKSNYGAIVQQGAVRAQATGLPVGPCVPARARRFLAAHTYGNATWRDLLSAIGAESGRSLDRWGREYILRPGMPVIDQAVRMAPDGRARLVLRQTPAQTLSGKGPWPIRTSVIVGQPDGRLVRLRVTLDSDSTVVPLPAGTAPPTFVYANADDYAYALVLPDERTVQWLERSERERLVPAGMLWGSLWGPGAGEARSRAIHRARAAQAPTSRMKGGVAGVLRRVGRAIVAYLPAERRDSALATVKLLRRPGRRILTGRTAYEIVSRAYIRVADAPSALAHLEPCSTAPAAGAPLRATRWAIVTANRTSAVGRARLRQRSHADSGSEGKRARSSRRRTPRRGDQNY